MPTARRPRITRRASLVWAAMSLLAAGACSGTGADGAGAGPTTQPADVAVSVPADGLTLAGTLRLPQGPGPHPGVVIAHGSGPQSRDGLAPGQLGLSFPTPVPVYAQLADGLRDAGFAVLTFDKRSCGPFNGCADNDYPTPPDTLTFDTFVDDVGRMLDALGDRAGIDRLALIGHSKGGTIAATLADRRDDLDAIVLLASPAAPIDEILTAQADTLAVLVRASGQGGQAAAGEQVDALRTLAVTVSDVANGQTDGPDVEGVPRSFWTSWIDASREAPERLAAADVPTLVLGGSNDWNVLPEQVDGWRPALGPDDDLAILPRITHALTHLDGDDPAAITPADVGDSVDEGLVTMIANWLQEQTG